jgi:hypothetical protein
MKNLLELQNHFVAGIYSKESSELTNFIKESGIPKNELFDIYRNNVFGTLKNALRVTFPICLSFLKKKEELKILTNFIKKNPSKTNNLDDYGEEFSQFLIKQKYYFLGDLAKMEWLKQKSYLAKNDETINLERLQKLTEEELSKVKFKLGSSVFFLTSQYSLAALRPRNRTNVKPSNFLIYRFENEIKCEKITLNQFNFLQGVHKNLSLFEIFELYQVDIEECLTKFLSNKVLSSFTI